MTREEFAKWAGWKHPEDIPDTYVTAFANIPVPRNNADHMNCFSLFLRVAMNPDTPDYTEGGE